MPGPQPDNRRQSSDRQRRSALRADVCFLAVILRSTAPRPGRVARLERCTCAALSINAPSRTSASARFLIWDRSVETTTLTCSPSAAITRAVTASPSPASATSHTNSAFESVVFTCWPPGPDERENRHVNDTGSSRRPAGVTGSVGSTATRQLWERRSSE